VGGVGGVRDRRAREARAGGRGSRLRLLPGRQHRGPRRGLPRPPLRQHRRLATPLLPHLRLQYRPSLVPPPKPSPLGSLAFCYSPSLYSSPSRNHVVGSVPELETYRGVYTFDSLLGNGEQCRFRFVTVFSLSFLMGDVICLGARFA
jgi:hypothetical protein